MWKEVFKAGLHADANGNEREWTEEDLNAIVEKYNNQPPDERHDAPVVIGHPVNNSPAYAWVEQLRKNGDTIEAKFTQIDPQFEDLIKEGRYKKVSIALYPDMMLRHVGFLGAIPPAVKGLKDANFNAETSFSELIIDNGELIVKIQENQEINKINPKNPKRDLSDSYANASQTQSETNAINRAKVIEPFVLNTLFKNRQFHAADKIDIEITIGSDKLAQFVNQHEGALPIKKLSKVVKTLSLPRTFEKKLFTALELANYKSVGNIYVTSPEERTNLANQMIQFGLLVVGLITFYIMLKRDNRKALRSGRAGKFHIFPSARINSEA